MAKKKASFVCKECGVDSPKWSGQCSGCQQWNTLVEIAVQSSKVDRFSGLTPDSSVTALGDVAMDKVKRISTGSSEFDRVLGGGIVPGSVILIGGDPGIGKSTLLTQYMAHINKKFPVIYTSGEESIQQIAIRGQRLSSDTSHLRVMAENNLERILSVVQKEQPECLVVDSIQTLFTDLVESAPGSVSQVRECTSRLVRYAKQNQCSVVLVGHVTKEGALAGPRVLEHMVDTVLYFEGEKSSSYRLIRAIKNRFGAVNEIGVFAMMEDGLKDVTNPSAMFVSRFGADTAGSIVLATQEGTRPLLVEVQALVDQCTGHNPKRLTIGLDSNRLSMILAIISRHGGLFLSDQDVFANVVGGVKVTETASDLALFIAIVSSLLNKPLGCKIAAFGEIGLTGEIRPVQNGMDRIKEAEKLGFDKVMIPLANAPKKTTESTQLITVKHIQDVLDFLQS